jgi:two-component system, OmpR family, phosphate regulon response regulator PhoB
VEDTLILVADSNPEIRGPVARELSERGYDVATASDGNQALDAILSLRPAAAVLEWVMPGLQGPTICAHLKASPDTVDIPVILLTARATEEDVVAAFEQGADDYLTKPFAVDELDEMLRRLISKNVR